MSGPGQLRIAPSLQRLTMDPVMPSFLHAAFAAAALAVTASAQCSSVTTLTTGTNSQNGTMFDVVNTSAAPITISSLDQCFAGAATATFVEIYTKPGTWNGSQQTPSAWTLVGRTNNFAHGTTPTLDPLPIPVNVTILPGATQGFYVTGDSGTTVQYTTGVAQLGAVIGSDASLQVRAGVGVPYPFAAPFGLPADGRLWNGRVNYCPAGSGSVLATNTSLGAGCVAAYNSFFELFSTATPAAAALSGNTLQLIPVASGYQGVWLPGTAAAFFVPPVAGVPLATADDGVVTYNLTSGSFPTPQGPQSALLVSGNAIVAWGGIAMDYPGTQSYAPTPTGFLNSTLGGIYAWHDYNVTESGSGQILAEEVGGVLYVTFNGVESYASPEGANPSTLQFQLDLATGGVRIVFVSVNGNATSLYGSGHLIGVTSPGASANPGSVALATASSAQLLTQNPETMPLALTATSRPVLGTTWNLTTSNVPATGLIGVDVLGVADPGIDDLFFLGAPGCGLRSSIDSTSGWFVAGGTHNYSLAIPNNPTLLNFNVYTTSAVFQVPQINAFGAITSNGVQGKLGDL